jgi:UDP-2,3-diacylglucosamine pyrophosphatase LpxH
MKNFMRVRSVILSDIHLGTPHSKVEEVTHFLKHVRCKKLILNGDIIRRVLTMVQKQDTEVIYLRGNHDDFLAGLLPLAFDNIQLAEDCTLETSRGRYLVLHGDVFDGVVKNMVFLAHLGDIGYALLLRLNRAYNWFRRLRGKEYFSLSKAIKARVKQAVSFVGKFEDQVTALARERGFAGVICGHIHTPADKMVDGIHYLNSGDWVESMTGIIEHEDGRLELFNYKDFAAQFPRQTQLSIVEDIEGHIPEAATA